MKTTKILIIWSLVIVALTHSFGQFTKFDPSKAINSQGAVALRREKIIAERSKKSLQKVKIN